jgi:hypothetical protein
MKVRQSDEMRLRTEYPIVPHLLQKAQGGLWIILTLLWPFVARVQPGWIPRVVDGGVTRVEPSGDSATHFNSLRCDRQSDRMTRVHQFALQAVNILETKGVVT